MIEQLIGFLHHPDQLIAWGGYVGLVVIVFSETGLLAGFFLPGDSLLVTAGLMAAQGTLDYLFLSTILTVTAIVGDSTGYWIGSFAGPRLFKREDSFFFHRKHVERTHQFFEKHGGKTIILARFVPIVRTFAPTVAGVGKMSYRKFFMFNVAGAVLWVWGMISIGFFLGKTIPDIDKHLHLVILVVIFVSFLPVLFEWRRSRKNNKSRA